MGCSFSTKSNSYILSYNKDTQQIMIANNSIKSFDDTWICRSELIATQHDGCVIIQLNKKRLENDIMPGYFFDIGIDIDKSTRNFIDEFLSLLKIQHEGNIKNDDVLYTIILPNIYKMYIDKKILLREFVNIRNLIYYLLVR